MKEYDVNNLKLLINGECINLGFLDLVKNKPINMEKYIASYKHLIGCEVFGLPKGRYIISVSDPNFCAEYNIPMSVCDNADYLTQFENMSGFKFYLDAGTHVNDSTTLGTYEEYMQLHYPEYEHVWKHHL